MAKDHMSTSSITTECIQRLQKNLGSFTKGREVKTARDWYDVYREKLYDFRMQITDEICNINGIDPDEIGRAVDIFGVVSLKNTNNIFFEKSKITWSQDDEKKSMIGQDTMMRIRFITFLLLSLNENLDNVIESITSKRENSSYKYDCEVLEDLIKTTFLMVNRVFEGKEYGNALLRFITKMEFLVSGVNHRKYNRRIVHVISDLKVGLSKGSFIDSIMKVSIDMPQDLAIDGLIKTAFMLRTGKSNLSHLPTFDLLEGVSLEWDLSAIISKMGKAAQRYEATPVYRAWESTCFDMFESKSADLREGVRTLQFLSFILNDKNISSFISSMIDF